MTRTHFWQGVGLGIVAGTLVGIKLKAEEKHVKRSVNKAKRNVEHFIDSVGM